MVADLRKECGFEAAEYVSKRDRSVDHVERAPEDQRVLGRQTPAKNEGMWCRRKGRRAGGRTKRRVLMLGGGRSDHLSERGP